MNDRWIVFSQTIMAIYNLKPTIGDTRPDKERESKRFMNWRIFVKLKEIQNFLSKEFKENAPIILKPINLCTLQFF